MITPDRPVLTLRELEAHDAHPSGGGDERRFNCPLPSCADKPLDRQHQSLAVNVPSGLWRCHRCGAGGRLREHWAPLTPLDRRALQQRRREAALRAVRLPPEPVAGKAPSAALLPQLLGRCVPLAGTPGHPYLVGRGIGLAVATRAGVTFCPDVYGRPAVVFPLHDRAGQVVALNARYTDGRTDPKTRSVGDRSLGVFATPALICVPADAPLVVVEGPLDALSLSACGVWAVALVCTVAPHWLAPALAFRRVLVGLDADAEGDTHAEALARELAPFARTVERLRPPAPKDWNDALQADYPGLVAFLEAHGLPG